MRCLRCSKYFVNGDKERSLCKLCSTKPFDKSKFYRKIDEVIFVLETQGRIKNYTDEINKIKNNEKLMYKFYWYNITEMLMQLEFNRRGWKVEYQKNDLINGFRYDFYIKEFKLDIEVDERSHNSKKQTERDKLRDKVLGSKHIVRIPEQLIRANIEKAADAPIIKIIHDAKTIEEKKDLNNRFKKAGINIDYKKFVQERLKEYENVV